MEEEATVMSTEELIEKFALERVSRNPAQFDEVKLRWLNGVYIRRCRPRSCARRLEGFTGREGLAEAARISQEKIQTLADFWPLAGFLFDGVSEDPRRARSGWMSAAGRCSHRRARPSRRRRASTRQGVQRALEGLAGAPGVQAARDLSAAARGDRRHRDLARHLRERRAAGARGDAAADRRALAFAPLASAPAAS